MDKEEEQEQRSLGFEPIHQKRERRAAVLICLFEGEEGDLRVILTKRSKNLSTHSGMDTISLKLFFKFTIFEVTGL